MSLSGKRILIVGGGSGIGFAVAEGAANEGADVIIASTNPERTKSAAARLGNHATARQVDVTDEASVGALFDAIGPLDHVVTTAGDWGGPRRGPLAELDLDAAQRLFAVRFWGAVRLAKHGAGHLNPGGSITFTDGMVAHRPSKGSAISTAMAGSIEHLTRALAVELSPLRVNCVCPGLIRTDVWNSIPEDGREARFTEMTKRQLVPRIGEASECAEAYLYLMKAGYTTGQVLHVEGGVALGG